MIDFGKEIGRKISQDFGVDPNDLDTGVNNIGVIDGRLVLIDYAWIEK